MKKIFRKNHDLFFKDSSVFEKLIGVTIYISCVIIAIVSMAIIAFLMYRSYIFIDKSSSNIYQGYGRVCHREFVPKHKRTVIISTGTITMPASTCCDDIWYLDVLVSDGCARVSVSEGLYNSISTNNFVKIEYTRGVLNQSNIYVKYIELKE